MSRPLIHRANSKSLSLGLALIGILLVGGCSDDNEPQRTTYMVDESGRLYASDHVVVRAAPGEAFETLVTRIDARGWSIMESDNDQRIQDTLGYIRVAFPVGTLPEEALAYLSSNSLIEAGTLNYQLQVQREPNDPAWGDATTDLWGHRFVGITDAWETTTGSQSTMVAVIDTGVDLSHVDLIDNLARLPEAPETVAGWDLVDGDTVPQDENGHGTHIAGIIGATGDNNLGSVGLNWNVNILPIRVFDADGQGSLWNAALGILLAAEAGAKVINASWGVAIDQPGPLLEATQHAIDQGALIVASAGNAARDLSDENFFPATLLDHLENRAILSIGSLTRDGNPSQTSNFGTSIDLWAPGRSIWSTLPGDTYGFEQGTSSAAAYASGIAALYASVVPNATGSEIATKLKTTGADASFGQLINAANVLREGLPPPEPAVITSVTPLPGASAEVTWDYPSAVRPDAFEVHWRVVEEPSEEDACFLPQIYGADGRKDFYQINQVNPLATQLADASVALFMNPNFIQRDASGGVSIYDRIIYGNYYNLCQSEPFWSQPIGSNCSGLLVGPDLVATAGHCIESQAACENITFAFGYRMDAADSPRTTLPANDVYGCAELVSQHYQGLPGHDYALVRLDREVVGHTPFPIQRTINLDNETPVVVGGHPKGLPWKYSDDARILSNSGSTYFLTSLDAYQGNSGSPVVREDTGEMVGILSFGTQANFWPSGSCNVSPQCDDSIPGACNSFYIGVSRLDAIVDLIPPLEEPRCESDASCDDGDICNGLETCDLDSGNCIDGPPPEPPILEEGTYGYVTVSSDTRDTVLTDLPLDRNLEITVVTVHADGERATSAAANTTLETLDPPPQVIDLVADTVTASILEPRSISASTTLNDGWGAEQLSDGSTISGWSSARTPSPSPTSIIIEFDSPQWVSSLELLAADAYPELFPKSVAVYGRLGFSPRTLLEAANLRESHYRSYFQDQQFDQIIIDITDMNRHVSGDYHAVLGDIILRGGHERSDALMLHFTAPGDDPNYGRATHYEVRWSQQAFPATPAAFEGLASQRLFTGPLAAGEAESLELDGLQGGTRYYIGLVAVDRHGNRSPISNLTTALTPVGIPPTVTDLSALRSADDWGTTLSFTAPHDRRGDAPSAYDIRISEQPIEPNNFGLATPLESVTPLTPGETVNLEIAHNDPNRAYFFAMKVVGDEGETSRLSNLALSLPARPSDTTEPAQSNLVGELLAPLVTDPPIKLTTSSEMDTSDLADGDRETDFAANVESGESITIEAEWEYPRLLHEVILYRSLFETTSRQLPSEVRVELSYDGIHFTTLEPGSLEVDEVSGRYFLGNHLAQKARITMIEPEGSSVAYHTLSGLEFRSIVGKHQALLSWIAPGDDLYTGRAAEYELRMGSIAELEASFDNGSRLAIQTPAIAGTIERSVIDELPDESPLGFQLRTYDDQNVGSALSNILSLATPTIPPVAIDILNANATQSGTLTIQVSQGKDDGDQGAATGYLCTLTSDQITHQSLCGPISPACSNCLPCSLQEAGQVTTLVLSDVPDNQSSMLRCSAVDDHNAVGLYSAPAPIRTFDTLAPNAPTDLIAQTEVRLLEIESVEIVQGQSTSLPEIFDANPYTVGTILPDGESSVVELTINPPTASTSTSHLAVRAGSFTSIRLWDRATGEILISEPRYIAASESTWTLLQFANVESQTLGLELGTTTIEDDDNTFSGVRIADIGILGPHAVVSFTSPYDPPFGIPVAAYEVHWETDLHTGITPWQRTPLPAGYIEERALPMAEFSNLPFDQPGCLRLDAVDAGQNRTSSVDDSCLSFEREMLSRVNGLTITADDDLNLARAELSFGYDAVPNLKSLDYFEIRDFNLSTDSEGRTLDNWTWDDADCVAKLYTVDGWSSSQGLSLQSCNGESTLTYLNGACSIEGSQLDCDIALDTAANDSRETLALALRIQNDSTQQVARSRLSNRLLFSRIAPPTEPINFTVDSVTSREIGFSFTSPTDYVLPRGGPASRYDLRWMVAPDAPVANWDDLLLEQGIQVNTAAPIDPDLGEALVIRGPKPEDDVIFGIRWQNAAGNWSPMTVSSSAIRMLVEPPATLGLGCKQESPGVKGPLSHLEVKFGPAGQDGTAYDDGRNDLATDYEICVTRREVIPLPDGLGPENSSCQRISIGNGVGVSRTANASDENGTYSIITELEVQIQSQPDLNTDGSSVFEAFEDGTLYTVSMRAFATSHRTEEEEVSVSASLCSVETPDLTPPEAIDDLTILTPSTGSLRQLSFEFRAPNDPKNRSGQASNYELLVATSEEAAAEGRGAVYEISPGAEAAGSLQNFSIGLESENGEIVLAPEQFYALRIRSEDGNENISNWSNIATRRTLDEDPADVEDLDCEGSVADLGAICTWTAPGDDAHEGIVDHYEMRIWSDTPANARVVEFSTGVNGGGPDTITFDDLDEATFYYFQLTAYDERGNSSVSNTVSLTTPIFPPADVGDLSCQRLAGVLRCNLTAVGDDTMRGYASRYIVRTVAHSALEEAELTTLCESADDGDIICGSEAFDSALALGLVTDLDVPNLAQPTFPGYPQVLDLSMFLFTPEERHYLRIDTIDDIDAFGISNIISFRSEGIPPNDPAITLCQPLTEDGALVGLEVIFRPAGDDGAEGLAEEHQLRWGSTTALTALNLLNEGNIATGALPAGNGNLKFRLANDALETPLSEAEELLFGVIAYDDWGYRSPFNDVARMTCWTPALTAPTTVTDLNVLPGTTAGTFQLAFSAPADSVGRTGRPERYQLGYQSALPNQSCDDLFEFDAFELIDLNLEPLAPGASQVFAIGNGTTNPLVIENETRYCFALRAIDAENNVADWSNKADETSPVVPPGVISNLACSFIESDAQVRCSFVGTGNDGSAGGAPLGYRISVTLDDGTNRVFDFVDNIEGPGTNQTFDFTPVSENTEHTIKVQAFDQASFGEFSPRVTTLVPAISPSVIEDLFCILSDELMDDLPVVCTFTEPGDDADDGCLDELRVYSWVGSAERPATCSNPLICRVETIEASETCGGTSRTMNLARFEEGSTQRLAILAVDDDSDSVNPESNQSSVIVPLIAPAEFELSCDADPSQAPRIDCEFIEPGDDQNEGTVSSYQVRYATTPITDDNFVNATIVNETLVPIEAGNIQSFSFSPNDGQSYSIAVKATDDNAQFVVGTTGQAVTVADITPPGSVGPVTAEPGETRGQLDLVFAPTGDDGQTGEASAYRVALSTTLFQSNTEVASEPGCVGEGADAICTFALDPVLRLDGKLEATIQGLLDETRYYLIVFAIDDEGNRGSSPTNATAWTQMVAPTVEEPVVVEDVSGRGVALTYTVPGDNELTGEDVTTELRWGYADPATTVCLNGSVNATTTVLPANTPGTTATFSLTSLETNRLICMQLVATDDHQNESKSAIHEAYLDTINPTAVSNVILTTTDLATRLEANFTPADATGHPNTITRYYAIVKPEQLDTLPISEADVTCSRGNLCQVAQGLSFIEVDALESTPQGGVRGQINELSAETAYFVAIVGLDEDENVGLLPASSLSSTPRIAPADFTIAPGEISATTAELIFLAPGDDDGVGFAERYEFYHRVADQDGAGRFSCPGDSEGYSLLLNHPTPLEGGERETILLAGLAPNTGHCVFTVAFDDYRSPQFPEGQSSTSENVVLFKTADPTAPAQIIDLIAEPGTGVDTLDIRFTAVGDDGQDGRAAYYEVIVLTEETYNAAGAPELGTTGLRFSDPEPLLAGAQESRTLTDLNVETTYAVFIRAVDEEDNRGNWSPAAFGSTAPIAPNPPTALSCAAALNSDQPALDCEVTEPGDEGDLGTEPVSALEVFISTDALDDESLDTLTPVDVSFIPATRLAGQVTQFNLNGLLQNTTYSIAVRAIDEFGLPSAGTFTIGTTLDLTPPGEVSNFDIVNAVDMPRAVSALATGSSSELSEGWTASFATDSDRGTSWVSSPRELQGEEWLALTLPENASIERTSFTVDEEFIDLFPDTWRIDISQDGTEWETVSSGTNDSVAANRTYEFAFPTTNATLVRWIAENGGIRDGKVFTALSEFHVTEARASAAEVVLSFSPPGDDDQSGGLSHLEVFWSTSELNVAGSEITSINGSQVVSSEKAGPFIPGSLVLHRIDGLPGEETIYVGLRGRDEAGLLGPLAQTSILTTPVAPAPVTLLEAINVGGSLSLSFTESGDDGYTGTVDHYLISFNDITLDVVTNTEPEWEFPLTVNQDETGALVADFNGNTMPDGQYQIQIQALDEAGNRSFPSNAVTVQIGEESDTEAPDCISGLSAVLDAETGAEAPISSIAVGTEVGALGALTTSDTLALTDRDSGTVYSLAQESEGLIAEIILSNQTRVQDITLHHIPGFESYLATVNSAACDGDNAIPELLELEPTLGDEGILLSPRVSGLTCSIISLELELPQLADHFVLGLAGISVTRSPYPSGTLTLSWFGTGDDGLDGYADSHYVSASCNGEMPVLLDALVLGTPAGPLAPERVVIPGDYLETRMPCESATEFQVTTCDDALNCTESALRIDWENGNIQPIETATCTAP